MQSISRQTQVGTVVKKSGRCTFRVTVERVARHPQYHKVMRSKHDFLVHDPTDQLLIGSIVIIAPCRPISKRVHHVVVEVKPSGNPI